MISIVVLLVFYLEVAMFKVFCSGCLQKHVRRHKSKKSKNEGSYGNSCGRWGWKQKKKPDDLFLSKRRITCRGRRDEKIGNILAFQNKAKTLGGNFSWFLFVKPHLHVLSRCSSPVACFLQLGHGANFFPARKGISHVSASAQRKIIWTSGLLDRGIFQDKDFRRVSSGLFYSR